MNIDLIIQDMEIYDGLPFELREYLQNANVAIPSRRVEYHYKSSKDIKVTISRMNYELLVINRLAEQPVKTVKEMFGTLEEG